MKDPFYLKKYPFKKDTRFGGSLDDDTVDWLQTHHSASDDIKSAQRRRTGGMTQWWPRFGGPWAKYFGGAFPMWSMQKSSGPFHVKML